MTLQYAHVFLFAKRSLNLINTWETPGGAATFLSCVTLRILLGNLLPATYGFYLCNPLACLHAVDMLRIPLWCRIWAFVRVLSGKGASL